MKERGTQGVRMDKDELSKYRAEVIERFINIEWIINGIISQNYFKRVIYSFVLEVLYDPSFSFALRRNILIKIVKDIDNQKVDELNRLNNIRNYFAHCNQEIFEASDKEKERGKIIDPKNIEKEINFESLYSEFIQKANGVEEYLFKLFIDLGGKALKE